MKILLNSLTLLMACLPLAAVRKLGAGFGRLLGLFGRRKAEVRLRIQERLSVSPDEARQIYKGMYRQLGMSAFETLRIPRMSEEEMLREITFVGKEKTEAFKETGYIAAVAHTGNWELMAAASSPQLGVEMHVVVKSLKPESLNNWITSTRARWGTEVHDRRGSVRDLIKVMKQGKTIGFIIDQNAKYNWGVFVDFFGKPACTSHGLAHLAAMGDKPIFPILCRRDPQTNKLIAEVHDQIPGPKDRSEEEVIRVTAAVTSVLEDFVRKYPDQWIWMHRRWRTRPEDAPAAE